MLTHSATRMPARIIRLNRVPFRRRIWRAILRAYNLP
jgi:hypothetical protein